MSHTFEKPLLALLQKLGAQGGTKTGLAKELSIPASGRQKFRELLLKLEEEGKIVFGKGGHYRLSSSRTGPAEISGELGFRLSGKWYVRGVGLDGTRQEWAIPEGKTGLALPGDTVKIKPSGATSRGRFQDPIAVVSALVERSPKPVVGLARKKGKTWLLVPDTPGWPPVVELTFGEDGFAGLEEGQVISARLLEWRSWSKPPVAQLLTIIGREGDPGVDLLTIVHKHGLPLQFPPEVLAATASLPDKVEPGDREGREDWRGELVITIDPFDARDFDDAISVKRLKNGGYELAVHIADVSWFVRPGGALDKEARNRGNSVYLADRVIPMLPEKLSNGLCSLQPDVDRLTALAVMTYGPEGRCEKTRFARAVICSRKRYTYEEAYARIIRDKAADPGDEFDAHMDLAWELASKLRRKRMESGALELDFPEVRALLDEKGRAIGLKRIEYDESHQLIEEFMLAANVAVAIKLRDTGWPAVFRVHDDPDPEKIWDFMELARVYGHQAPDLLSPTAGRQLSVFLRSVRGKPEEHLLKVALLRSLKRAVYHHEPLSHFGLATMPYLHFTSPIRRYADLVVHRALFGGKSHRLTDDAAMQIARHLSSTERSAADAEMESQQLKQLEYLDRTSREENPPRFRAVVFEAKPFGALIELIDYQIRGAIRSKDLVPGQWYFEGDTGRSSKGRRGRTIAVGDELAVVVKRVQIERKWADFIPVDEVGTARPS
jgi:ribonuclease R